MELIITGVSSKDSIEGQDQDLFIDSVSKILSLEKKDILLFDPEIYFDANFSAKYSELLLKYAILYAKYRYGFMFGDIVETFRDQAYDILKYMLHKKFRKQLNKTLKEIIIHKKPTRIHAHSLGSTIIFDTLRHMDKNHYKNIELITYGSPLWMKSIRFFLGEKELQVLSPWKNFYSTQDLISRNQIPEDTGILSLDQFNTYTDHDFLSYLKVSKELNF